MDEANVMMPQACAPMSFNLTINLDAPCGKDVLCLTGGFNEAG